jgi:F-type H+-transporting ATPase subunit delta
MVEPKEQFADVSAQRLAGIYAQALLNAAEDKHCVAQVIEEIDSLIDDVFTGNRQLGLFITSGAVGRRTRKEAIEKAFSSRASDTFYKFLLVLNDHERLDLIRPIRRALHDLHDERARRLRVHLYSAVPLSEEAKGRIMTAVHEFFKLEPVLESHVDPALLGGLKIRIGDRVFDGTVQTRIDNLRNQLIARSSHEIQSGRNRFSSAE